MSQFLGTHSASGRAALIPPDLSGVGARLLPVWLHDSLAGKTVSNRPWLSVRMPRFSLKDAELLAIAKRLAVADAIPDLVPSRLSDYVPEPHAASRLTGPKGFNCASCHYGSNSSEEGQNRLPISGW